MCSQSIDLCIDMYRSDFISYTFHLIAEFRLYDFFICKTKAQSAVENNEKLTAIVIRSAKTLPISQKHRQTHSKSGKKNNQNQTKKKNNK